MPQAEALYPTLVYPPLTLHPEVQDEAKKTGDCVRGRYLLCGRVLPLPDAGQGSARPRQKTEHRGELPEGMYARHYIDFSFFSLS